MTDDFELIKSRIKESGFKIKFLAKEIGVKPNTLSLYINGRRGLGSSAKILLFALLKIDSTSIKEQAS